MHGRKQKIPSESAIEMIDLVFIVKGCIAKRAAEIYNKKCILVG